jgi:hypothetical protein
MKTLNAAGILAGIGLLAKPMLATGAPRLSVQSEPAAQPRIVEAINTHRSTCTEIA